MTKLYYILLLCALTSAYNVGSQHASYAAAEASLPNHAGLSRRDTTSVLSGYDMAKAMAKRAANDNVGYKPEQVRTASSASDANEDDGHRAAVEGHRRRLQRPNFGASPKFLSKPPLSLFAKLPKYNLKLPAYSRSGEVAESEAASKHGEEQNEDSSQGSSRCSGGSCNRDDSQTDQGDASQSAVRASEASEVTVPEAENSRRFNPYNPNPFNPNPFNPNPFNPNPFLPNPFTPTDDCNYNPYPYNPCDPCNNNCPPLVYGPLGKNAN